MIKRIIQKIVGEAELLIKERINEQLIIDFVDIFPQSIEERNKLIADIKTISDEVQKTKTGELYKLNKPINTKYGLLTLIKIRMIDPIKTQRGAPDFKVKDYLNFKKKYVNTKNFKLIIRQDYEMLELKGEKVLIYFPSETLSESLRK